MTLRVILQIVPQGDESQVREIGRLDISQIRQLDGNCYIYEVINLSPGDIGKYNIDVVHDRTEGAWTLVERAIWHLDIEGPE